MRTEVELKDRADQLRQMIVKRKTLLKQAETLQEQREHVEAMIELHAGLRGIMYALGSDI